MDRDFVPVSSPVERSAPIRLVLDTNIMVSALISKKGPPGFLLAAAKGEGCTLITSRFQIDELQRVLAREQLRVNIPQAESDDLLASLDAVAEVVDKLPEVRLSPDPDDNPILATAIAGKADLVVSATSLAYWRSGASKAFRSSPRGRRLIGSSARSIRAPEVRP